MAIFRHVIASDIVVGATLYMPKDLNPNIIKQYFTLNSQYDEYCKGRSIIHINEDYRVIFEGTSNTWEMPSVIRYFLIEVLVEAPPIIYPTNRIKYLFE